MRKTRKTKQNKTKERRSSSLQKEGMHKKDARSQPATDKKRTERSGKELKKAVPADGAAALAVLQRVVEAEEQFRANDVDPTHDSEQLVVDAAKDSATGQEQLAILSQLAGGTVMHQQVDIVYQKKEMEKQAKELRNRRLVGFCYDAQKVGYALADVYASEDGIQAQEVLLASLADLQEKMVQTEDTVAVLCGEKTRDCAARKQISRSKILRHMLTAVCSRNHLAGEKLVKQIGTTLANKDADKVNYVLSECRVEAAYKELVGDGSKESGKAYLVEIKEALAGASSQKAKLSGEEFSRLKERLHIEVAQQSQLESLIKVIKLRHVVSEYCSCVMEGDRAGAYKLLHDAETITASVRQKLTQILTCTQWETSVARFIDELSRMVMRKSPVVGDVIMPDEKLSPFDVSLVLELTHKYSPEIQFENEQVVMLAKQLIKKAGSEDVEYARPEASKKAVQGHLSQSVSALSAVRYIVNGVLSCRKKNECVHTFLETAKRNLAFSKM